MIYGFCKFWPEGKNSTSIFLTAIDLAVIFNLLGFLLFGSRAGLHSFHFLHKPRDSLFSTFARKLKLKPHATPFSLA